MNERKMRYVIIVDNKVVAMFYIKECAELYAFTFYNGANVQKLEV